MIRAFGAFFGFFFTLFTAAEKGATALNTIADIAVEGAERLKLEMALEGEQKLAALRAPAKAKP